MQFDNASFLHLIHNFLLDLTQVIYSGMMILWSVFNETVVTAICYCLINFSDPAPSFLSFFGTCGQCSNALGGRLSPSRNQRFSMVKSREIL